MTEGDGSVQQVPLSLNFVTRYPINAKTDMPYVTQFNLLDSTILSLLITKRKPYNG